MLVQWVNKERTVLVRGWLEISDHAKAPHEAFSRLEVCTREDSDAIWGPPVEVELERV